jgi:phenylacetic acid degradation operon negative regulatory protein
MHAKTELLLHLAEWFFLDVPLSATPRGINRMFAPWGYADELPRQLQRLRERQLLEAVQRHESQDRASRLTALGRAALHGPADPHERWSRPWDRTWRLVTFDLPEDKHAVREAWRRHLRRLKFGCLQGSVWVSPDPVDEIKAALTGAAVRTKRLLFIEGRPAAGESDAEIVSAAWNFERINELYAQHGRILDAAPPAHATPADLRARLPAWTRRELAAWKEIVARDPFLPRALCPPGYAGPTGLAAREARLKQVAATARTLLAE